MSGVAGVFGDEAAALDAGLAADAGAAGADLASLDDAALSELLGSAGSDDEMNRILGELDRRDQAAAAEQKVADAAAKRSAAAEAKHAAMDARYEELVAQGKDPIEAYAEAFGKDPEKVRVKDAISGLRASGYQGRNLLELAQDAQKDWAYQAWLNAEGETNGFLLNEAGRNAGIDPRSLFVGQESRARKYASDELLAWFDAHGRLTVDDFVSSALGGKARSLGTGYFL